MCNFNSDEKPLVSIVIPAYNCEAFIQKSLDSILNQTYQKIEIVIADDGSTDRTKEIIDSFQDKRIKRFHNDENLGNIRTRNKLFGSASGDFITIQDADDWSHHNRIQKQLDILLPNPSFGACVTNYIEVDVYGRLVNQNKVDANFLLTTKELNNLPRFPPASIMLRKQVYEDIGGLNLYFERLFGEDIYWIYLILEKYQIIFLKEAYYYYRHNLNSLTIKVDQERKLSIIKLIEELFKQRQSSGYDWLSTGDLIKAQEFENNLLKEKKWLGNQYRIKAARHTDLQQFRMAYKYLKKSFFYNPISFSNIKTSIYLLRSFINHDKKNH